MIDCWHTQCALIHNHFPDMRLRVRRSRPIVAPGIGGVSGFVYVLATVDDRRTRCPPEVIAQYRELGYTIIRIEEPR